MRTIWKFPLAVVDGPQRIAMPVGAAVRRVAGQGAQPCLWAESWQQGRHETRTFHVFGTGHAIAGVGSGATLEYVGSADCGPFVWHVYEEKEIPF